MGTKFLVAFATAITLSVSARATAIFTINDGVDPVISVADNGPGDQASATGVIVVQTNVGVWALTINTAITKPVVGSPTSPVMDINLQAYSTAAGSLTLTFSDNNFGPAMGILNATETGYTVAGATSAATMNVWGDPGNVTLAETDPILALPSSVLPLPPGSLTETGSGALTLGAPYSLTESTTVTASGATIVNLDASFYVIPEPGIPALGALGFAGWALFRMRNRRA